MEKGWESVDENEVLVEDSAARKRLLALSEDGSECRRRALLIDPGLAVRNESESRFSDRDVAEVKAAVIGAARLLSADAGSRQRSSRRLSSFAVALALLLVFLLPSDIERAFESALAGPVTGTSQEGPAITHPAVEAIAPSGARVYELAEEDFSVVLFVDESFKL